MALILISRKYRNSDNTISYNCTLHDGSVDVINFNIHNRQDFNNLIDACQSKELAVMYYNHENYYVRMVCRQRFTNDIEVVQSDGIYDCHREIISKTLDSKTSEAITEGS